MQTNFDEALAGDRVVERRGLPTQVWLPWVDGPERTDSPALVSLTEFTSRHPSDLFGIAYAALRLRAGWYGLPGAVGLWLWADLRTRTSGSVSVWTDETQMRRWVRLPLHVQIMKRYRDRGTVRATTWESDDVDPNVIRRSAADRLREGDFS